MTQKRTQKLYEQVDAIYGAGLGLNMNLVAEIVMGDLPVTMYSRGANPWAEMKKLIIDRMWAKA